MVDVTHTKEIEEAILTTIGTDKECVDVRALRPAYDNKQNAIVIMKESDANKLIDRKVRFD